MRTMSNNVTRTAEIKRRCGGDAHSDDLGEYYKLDVGSLLANIESLERENAELRRQTQTVPDDLLQAIGLLIRKHGKIEISGRSDGNTLIHIELTKHPLGGIDAVVSPRQPLKQQAMRVVEALVVLEDRLGS